MAQKEPVHLCPFVPRERKINMENKAIKFLAYNKKVSVMCIDTTELVEQIRKIHDLTPTVTAAAGRVATVAAMMAHLETKEITDNITIQIKGTGPIGSIVAVAGLENEKLANVKMYIQNPHVELPLKANGKIDVGGAVGNQGYLNVIKQNELTNSNYNGLIPLVSGEIAEDFTEFFAKSEQKPTALALGVLVNKDGVKRAGGYIINPMPDATEEEISKIEEAIKKAKPISEMLDDEMTLEEIAKIVTGDENIETLEQDLDVIYKCNCSKEKIDSGIISLGKEEISKIIQEDGKLEAECHFCHKKYQFSLEELKEIEKGAK